MRLFGHSALDAWRDRALSSERRLDELLGRISVTPNVQVAPTAPGALADTPTYITDEPYMDAAWAELKGIEGPEPVEVEE